VPEQATELVDIVSTYPENPLIAFFVYYRYETILHILAKRWVLYWAFE
jgi:hypothetical protein